MNFNNLMSLEEIKKMKGELIKRFNELKINQTTLLESLAIVSEVDEWKFGKDPFAVYPVPHALERWGYKTAPLLKKKYSSIEDGSNHKLHSCGFKDGTLRITLSPIENVPKIDIETFSYESNITHRTLFKLSPVKYHINDIVYNSPKVSLEAVEDFISINPKTKLAASFNIRGDFLAFAYEFDDNNRLISATFADEEGSEGSEYVLDYSYNDKGELCKVAAPDDSFIAWEKKKNK